MYEFTDKEVYKILRKRKKITLEQLSNYLDISISTISRYENDIKSMTQEQVKKYIEYIENK